MKEGRTVIQTARRGEGIRHSVMLSSRQNDDPICLATSTEPKKVVDEIVGGPKRERPESRSDVPRIMNNPTNVLLAIVLVPAREPTNVFTSVRARHDRRSRHSPREASSMRNRGCPGRDGKSGPSSKSIATFLSSTDPRDEATRRRSCP